MDYTLIKYKPNSDIDDLFKRILLKICQLYPSFKKEIELIVNELQQYRNLLEQKLKVNQQLNYDNVRNTLKKIDDKLGQFYNNERISKPIFIKQLKIISKLLNEAFNENDYNKMDFNKLYLLNKEKYDQLTPENKDIFFDIYTSNNKVKPIMKILKLWLSIKDKKIRNTMRQEINLFKSTLKQDVFKDAKTDFKDYIVKSNDTLQKTIRQEVKQTLTGNVLDKLRNILNKSFDTKGFEAQIDSDLYNKLVKFRDLKAKYSNLIDRYDNTPEIYKPTLLKQLEEGLYDITPLYNEVNDKFTYFVRKFNDKNKKEQIIDSFNRIDKIDDKPTLEKLNNDFRDNIDLFTKEEQDKYKNLINQYFDEKYLQNLTSKLNKKLYQMMIDLNGSKGIGKLITDKNTFNQKIYAKLQDTVNSETYDIKNEEEKKKIREQLLNESYLINLFNKGIDEGNIEADRLKQEEEKKKQEEELKKIKEAEELKKIQEEKEKERKIIEDRINKAKQEEESLKIIKDLPEKTKKEKEELEKKKFEEEKTLNERGLLPGGEDNKGEGCNIFDIQNKTLTQILQEINDKYNKLPNQKLDGVIYINLKKRFPNKEDFNKFFIQQLKKFDKKYNYEKYKQYMSEKKYSKKYIDELNKGGFLGPLISGVVNIGKKLLGFNQDAVSGFGLLGTIFNGVKSLLGLGDDVFEQNEEDLKKLKPLIDLLKKEKNNKMVDSYLYAIVKIELEDEDENKIKETFNNLLFKYDELYRPKLHKQRLDKNYYDVKAGFPFLALAPLIPTALSSISNLINSIRGKGCNDDALCASRDFDKSKSSINKKVKGKNQNVLEPRGGKILSLADLKELQKQIK